MADDYNVALFRNFKELLAPLLLFMGIFLFDIIGNSSRKQLGFNNFYRDAASAMVQNGLILLHNY